MGNLVMVAGSDRLSILIPCNRAVLRNLAKEFYCLFLDAFLWPQFLCEFNRFFCRNKMENILSNLIT